jgi:hypothetical protein
MLGVAGCCVLLALPTAAQQSHLDPCALVATADIAAITGQTVDGPKPQGIGICAWQIAGRFALTIQYNETGQAGFNNAKSLTQGVKPVSGIGDAAFRFRLGRRFRCDPCGEARSLRRAHLSGWQQCRRAPANDRGNRRQDGEQAVGV